MHACEFNIVSNYKCSSFLKIKEMNLTYRIRIYLGYYLPCIHRQEFALVLCYNTQEDGSDFYDEHCL